MTLAKPLVYRSFHSPVRTDTKLVSLSNSSTRTTVKDRCLASEFEPDALASCLLPEARRLLVVLRLPIATTVCTTITHVL